MFESELRISLYKAMEIGETHRNKHSSWRYLLYSTFWIRLKFQEDCFKSDIATIAWEGHLKLCLLFLLIYFWFILSFAFQSFTCISLSLWTLSNTSKYEFCNIQSFKYRVTHTGWDFKDDCTDFILSISLHSAFFVIGA